MYSRIPSGSKYPGMTSTRLSQFACNYGIRNRRIKLATVGAVVVGAMAEREMESLTHKVRELLVGSTAFDSALARGGDQERDLSARQI